MTGGTSMRSSIEAILPASVDRRLKGPVETMETSASERASAGEGDSASEVFVADPISSKRAAKYAVRAAERVCRGSQVIDREMEEAIPRFCRSELSLGLLLGKGGFSDVYEISSIRLYKQGEGHPGSPTICNPNSDDEDNDTSLKYPKRRSSRSFTDDEDQCREEHEIFQRMQRSFLSEHCIREKLGLARYAIKHLSQSCVADERQFRTGACDLAVEAKFLSSLEHPNIIKLRGLASAGPEGFATGLNTSYFLILDRLYGTLEERLGIWAHKNQKLSSSNFIRRGLSKKGELKKSEMFAARMKVAFDIAGALEYLHSHNVIYRDLKPENIGFDVRGDIKIFDFGLAKELSCLQPLEDGTYRMSGNTGSLRYMAPEVARCQDYNLSADVYSYAVLLWQITSLEKPYAGMDRREHANSVVYGLTRPKIDPSWSKQLCDVMSSGWHPSLHERPTMGVVYRMIRAEVADLFSGEGIVLDHRRRRSTHVLGKQRSIALSKVSPARAKAA